MGQSGGRVFLALTCGRGHGTDSPLLCRSQAHLHLPPMHIVRMGGLVSRAPLSVGQCGAILIYLRVENIISSAPWREIDSTIGGINGDEGEWGRQRDIRSTSPALRCRSGPKSIMGAVSTQPRSPGDRLEGPDRRSRDCDVMISYEMSEKLPS